MSAYSAADTMSVSAKGKNRRVIFIRHGHRLDRYIREAYPNINHKGWVNECFNKNVYRQLNLEMPLYLPKRNPMNEYNVDPPLTTMGEMCSQLMGNRLAECGLHMDMVFTSPALRCVQTTFRVLQGYADLVGETNTKMKIEGGLYEFGSFAEAEAKFATADFCSKRGIVIDTSYKSFVVIDDLQHFGFEEFNDYKKRTHNAFNYMFNVIGKSADTILMVTHGPAMMTFIRQLLRKPLENNPDLLTKVVNKPSYVASITLEQDYATRQWFLCNPQPIPSFEIRANTSYNQVWLDKTSFE